MHPHHARHARASRALKRRSASATTGLPTTRQASAGGSLRLVYRERENEEPESARSARGRGRGRGQREGLPMYRHATLGTLFIRITTPDGTTYGRNAYNCTEPHVPRSVCTAYINRNELFHESAPVSHCHSHFTLQYPSRLIFPSDSAGKTAR